MQLGLLVKHTVVVEKQCINLVFISSFMKIGFARECVKHVHAVRRFVSMVVSEPTFSCINVSYYMYMQREDLLVSPYFLCINVPTFSC